MYNYIKNSDYTRNIYQIINNNSTGMLCLQSFRCSISHPRDFTQSLNSKLLEMLIELQNDSFDLFCMFFIPSLWSFRLFLTNLRANLMPYQEFITLC